MCRRYPSYVKKRYFSILSVLRASLWFDKVLEAFSGILQRDNYKGDLPLLPVHIKICMKQLQEYFDISGIKQSSVHSDPSSKFCAMNFWRWEVSAGSPGRLWANVQLQRNHNTISYFDRSWNDANSLLPWIQVYLRVLSLREVFTWKRWFFCRKNTGFAIFFNSGFRW